MTKRKILVIDDQRDVRSFLEKTLRMAGYDVLSLHVVPSMQDIVQEKPDIIIIDLLLPGTMGHVLGKHIIEERRGLLPCVILISGRNEDILRQKASEIGADGYLAKPFAAGEIIALVDALLKRDA